MFLYGLLHILVSPACSIALSALAHDGEHLYLELMIAGCPPRAAEDFGMVVDEANDDIILIDPEPAGDAAKAGDQMREKGGVVFAKYAQDAGMVVMNVSFMLIEARNKGCAHPSILPVSSGDSFAR
jgi:hypothetical protein